MSVAPLTDRRRWDRLEPPVCKRCQAREPMTAVTRNDRIVHFRCFDCGNVVDLEKPKAAPPRQ